MWYRHETVETRDAATTRNGNMLIALVPPGLAMTKSEPRQQDGDELWVSLVAPMDGDG